MKRLVILLALFATSATGRISMGHFYADLSSVDSARLKQCRDDGGCHVVTQRELMDALRAAHTAGQRSARNEQGSK